eukprot:66555-Prymnesium_polylepis.1
MTSAAYLSEQQRMRATMAAMSELLSPGSSSAMTPASRAGASPHSAASGLQRGPPPPRPPVASPLVVLQQPTPSDGGRAIDERDFALSQLRACQGELSRLRERCAAAEASSSTSVPTSLVAADLAEFGTALSAAAARAAFPLDWLQQLRPPKVRRRAALVSAEAEAQASPLAAGADRRLMRELQRELETALRAQFDLEARLASEADARRSAELTAQQRQ